MNVSRTVQMFAAMSVGRCNRDGKSLRRLPFRHRNVWPARFGSHTGHIRHAPKSRGSRPTHFTGTRWQVPRWSLGRESGLYGCCSNLPVRSVAGGVLPFPDRIGVRLARIVAAKEVASPVPARQNRQLESTGPSGQHAASMPDERLSEEAPAEEQPDPERFSDP